MSGPWDDYAPAKKNAGPWDDYAKSRTADAVVRGRELSGDNLAGSVSQGALFGFADEAAAAVRSALPGFSNWMMSGPALKRDASIGGSPEPQTVPTGGTFGERYDQNLGEIRAQQGAFSEANPWWDAGGRVTGALATLPMMPKALLGGGVARATATGAGFGGLAGFGEGEGNLTNRLVGAGKGAVIGGALGGGLSAGGSALGTAGNILAESRAGRAVTDKVIRPGMNAVADAFDRMAPRVQPGSLSAAAPEGGPGIMGDSLLGNIGQAVRSAAPSADDTLREGAIRRIADAFRRGEMDVATAQARLAELGEAAMPADLNPMVTRLARTAYISPGSAPNVIDDAMMARNRATGDRIIGTIDQAMPNSGSAVLEASRQSGARLAQGNKDYGAALLDPNVKLKVSGEMQTLLKVPALQEVVKRIQAEAAANGKALTPAQVAHRVKRQLANDADAAFASGKAVNKSDVGDLAEQWRKALHDANPLIKKADDAYKAVSDALDALELGRQFMRQGTGEVADAVSPAVLAERIPRMSADEARNFIAGAADTLKGQAASGLRKARGVAATLDENQNVRSKLVTMLGEQNANALFNRAMAERRFAATDRAIRGGSDTAGKLLSALDDAATGGVPTSPSSMASRLLAKLVDSYNQGRAGNEAVRRRIAEMLTETDSVAHAELLDRIAAEIARAQAPRTVNRGVTRAITAQEFP